MNTRPTRLLAVLALLALLVVLPSAQVQSQTPVGVEVIDMLQQIAGRNQEILQKQEQTIRDLDEILESARQARIFSKRG